VTVAQSGGGAQVAYLRQDGLNNVMTVTQNGGPNTADVDLRQLGERNAMTLTQNGDNNMALLKSAS
jgi:hypothetical protein